VRVRWLFAEGVTIRAALLFAFSLMFVLWLFSGYYLSRRITEVQAEAAAIDSRYVHAQEVLSSVRAQALLASVAVRDALLDPNPTTTPDYRRQVADTFHGIDASLDQYEPILDPAAERKRVNELRQQIEQFRRTLDEVLVSDSTRWPTEARSLLRSRIVPRREGVLRLSEEIQALNRNAVVQQQTATRLAYADTQRSVWMQIGLALAASFGILLIALRFVSRLEHRLRDRIEKDAETSRDLQRLSAQLITVQEEERRIIARELHDEVGQVLTAIKVELALADRRIEAGTAAGDLLSPARVITERALHTVRNLSHLLHPSVLDDLGLVAAIDAYRKEVAERHGVAITLVHESMSDRLPEPIEAAAYRVVQEALTNVVKHSNAAGCQLHLQRLASSILIAVEDDGVGFDVARVQHAGASAGLGLVGIRERVAQVRGTVRVESAPSKGTRLTIELPAPPRDHAAAIQPDGAAATVALAEEQAS
jgi:signal transduction histidine kinase